MSLPHSLPIDVQVEVEPRHVQPMYELSKIFHEEGLEKEKSLVTCPICAIKAYKKRYTTGSKQFL